MQREMNIAGQKIHITIFTDPLCCWSWAFDTQLHLLQQQFGGSLKVSYRMGGLLPAWDHFHDNANSVSRPAQMGPLWMQAGQIASKPIAHTIWILDPPASSYPACITVKCAQLQQDLFGEKMLGMLRDACMSEGRNIAKQEVLLTVAEQLAAAESGFDYKKFSNDYFGDAGLDAFKEDLQLVAFHKINRFPTFIINYPGAIPVLMDGYRHHEEVLQAIERLKASSEKANAANSPA